jgi:type IV secretion system protein VirD4
MTDPWGQRPAIPAKLPPQPQPQRSGCLTFIGVLFGAGMVLLSVLFLAYAFSNDARTNHAQVFVFTVGSLFLVVGVGVWVLLNHQRPAKLARRKQKRLDHEQHAYESAYQTWLQATPQFTIANHPHPISALMQIGSRTKSTCFLGVSLYEHAWIQARRDEAILVLGPPRSGKTQGIIIPSIVSADGPVVATSTKNDVMDATYRVRRLVGQVWLFDPSGEVTPPPGVRALRWSPVLASGTWDSARAMADAMVGASAAGQGVTDASHWTESAKRLLAPLLWAAALGDCDISDVRRWILRGEFDEPGEILDERGNNLAGDSLASIRRTEDRERSSIISTAATVLSAYDSESVLASCAHADFNPTAFVESMDTIYIVAPSNLQDLLAPLVVGLLESVRDATYKQARRMGSPGYVLFALDELANIAPIRRLPGMVSEAGGQGLQLLACLQDLSQARARWGTAADGFLSLFGTKVVFQGSVTSPRFKRFP